MSIKNHISGLQHVGIPTKILDESVVFYESLGFETAYHTTIENEYNTKVTFLKLNDLVIEVYEEEGAVGSSGAIDHIALNVTDISSVWEMIKAKGYNILNKEIEFLPFWENGVKHFTIEGPNKEKVEFCEYL